jgi:hypothetical protein
MSARMIRTAGRLAACGALLLGVGFTLAHASCASVAGLDSDPCTPSSPPPPPPSSSETGDGSTISLALQGLNFAVSDGTDGGPPSVGGLDLDHACSREDGTPTTCVESPLASPHKDDSNGVDNAFGWLLADNQIQLNRVLSRKTDQRITLLLRLTGYNGQADDDNVEVEVFTTAGVEPIDDAGRPAEPRWDGTDRWTVSCETFASCDGGALSQQVTAVSDTMAYVSGGVLVSANLGLLPAARSFAQQGDGGFLTALINLNDPVLVAPLTHGDAGVEIHGGILGARWRTAELIAMVAALPGVCISPNESMNFVCPVADLASHAKLDGTGHACDALSVGMAFDAHPATITSHLVPIVYPSPCDAGPAADCP